ncbi:MAG: hypothetical protein Q7V63_06960 [Gammaproteobacteria bacterium]|nr:hypothetical protein [Gammaproteobacteria bacterium]
MSAANMSNDNIAININLCEIGENEALISLAGPMCSTIELGSDQFL